MLRCATWLAPGLPLEFFEFVSSRVADALGTEATLESYTATSGPDRVDDPFAQGEIDLGFMCAPSYKQLAAAMPSTVQLVPAAAVFADERNGGRPAYFVELVVRDGVDARSLSDLAGARIGFNDHRSLSGRLALEQQLIERELDAAQFALVHTGGHQQSLALLASGDVDAASIDSNTLLVRGSLPAGLRVLETWGPFPIQPVVANASMPNTTLDIITTALLTLDRDPSAARALREFHVERFASVSDADYR